MIYVILYLLIGSYFGVFNMIKLAHYEYVLTLNINRLYRKYGVITKTNDIRIKGYIDERVKNKDKFDNYLGFDWSMAIIFIVSFIIWPFIIIRKVYVCFSDKDKMIDKILKGRV